MGANNSIEINVEGYSNRDKVFWGHRTRKRHPDVDKTSEEVGGAECPERREIWRLWRSCRGEF